ncbi:MAG: alcohol dehydrogenase catalytic domain-containing protein [Sedimentisphaerales bacterium]|nr:alcohol dehydrogenase catalytic domain-containing protein [Sedimentisphaerales bacterium]
MKAMVLTGLRQMELMDWPKPEIKNDDDVLLKIEKVGICGSDVHYYETGKIGVQVVEYPFIVGHECSATVEAVGSGVKRVKVGDPVVVDPAAPCNKCDQCLAGRENTCHNVRFLGTPGQGGGCLCEYIVMPEECCYPTKNRLTLDQGALCEPFSIGVYTVKRANMPKNAHIGILGAGPIGLSVLAAARAEGAEKIYVTDKIDSRLTAAKAAGAMWVGNVDAGDIVGSIVGGGVHDESGAEPHGLDVVFECCGQQEALDQAVELLKPGGTLAFVGIPRQERVSFEACLFRRKEIELRNIRRQNGCVQAAMDLIGSGQADIDYMVTHRFELAEAKDAFDLVAAYDDGVIKAMIDV